MTKNTPRIFISLLLMLLCIGILPVSAFASSGDYPDDALPAAESSAADTQETKQIGTVTTNGGNLNVRTGAGLDNTAFTQLPNGTVVDVIGRDGDWVKILLPARVGYVYGSYLTVTDAADSTVSIGGITLVLPVVEKEILWSKRCKDEKLRGTVKEVVHQISHSKKWKSDIPLTDEKGNPLLRKNGKPMFRASYSILQDELFNYMTERGFKGFQRGEYGSTAEHLTSLQYQIKQDKERLEKLQKRIQREQIKYEPARNVSKTYNEIDSMGQKTITGKMAISKEDYSQLTALAKEGITSRAEISELEQNVNYYRQKYFDCANALERMKTKYNELKEKCRPFLQALEHFPEVAKLFTEKVKQLFSFKEAQERAEKEAREKERQERIKARRSKRGMER